MLVLGGNLFLGFRESLAVMNRPSLSVYKNIVCKAMMYVRQTVLADRAATYTHAKPSTVA